MPDVCLQATKLCLTDPCGVRVLRDIWRLVLGSWMRRYQSLEDLQRKVRQKRLRCSLPVDSISLCPEWEQSTASGPATRRAPTGRELRASGRQWISASQPAPGLPDVLQG